MFDLTVCLRMPSEPWLPEIRAETGSELGVLTLLAFVGKCVGERMVLSREGK